MKRTIIKIKDIKLRKDYGEMNPKNLEERKKYYNYTGEFEREVYLNENNVLHGGYSTYLIAKEEGFKTIPVIIATRSEKMMHKYILNKIEELKDKLCRIDITFFKSLKIKIAIKYLESVAKEIFENEEEY